MTTSDLTGWLRARSDTELAALFARRPDLVTPVPADLAVVGSRAGLRMSVATACERLNLFALELLQALVLLGDQALRGAGVPVETLVSATGLTDEQIEPTLADLRDLALVYGDDDALQVAAAVPDVVGPVLLGLGRPVRECLRGYVPVRLRQLATDLGLPTTGSGTELQAAVAAVLADPAPVLARAGDDERAVLARLATDGPVGQVADAARPVTEAEADSPVRWLVAVGLLVVTGGDTVELPREVGLAVRGGLGPLHPRPPELPSEPVQQESIDGRGAGQAAELVRLTGDLLDAIADDPPKSLRSGGVGVRELRRLARGVAVPEPDAAVLLEVAHAARLLDLSASAEPVWLPTTEYDAWRELTIAAAWARLAETWLRMSRLPALAGERDDRDKVLAPLSPELERATAAQARRQTLSVIPAGRVVEAEQLVARLRWAAPRRVGRMTEPMVGWSLREGALLGLLVGSALTTAARALLDDDTDRAARLLTAALPDPVDHVLVQPDLSVIAPGPLKTDLRETMDRVADVESAGAATVYRITEASLRRALDTGMSGGDLLEFFAGASRTPVPQSLEYLVTDLSRRHGLLRAGAAGSYLRCDDDTMLQQVLATKQLAAVGAHRLAAGVLVAAVGPDELVDALRRAGFAPVTEDANGTPVLSRPPARRTTVRRRPAQVRTTTTIGPERLSALVTSLRSGDVASRRREDRPTTGHAEVLSALVQAIRDAEQVQVDYVDSDGRGVSRTVAPHRMEGGYVTAVDHRSESRLSLALHRITAVHRTDG